MDVFIIFKQIINFLTGWTFIIILYLIVGVFVIIKSFQQQQWLGILFGDYFFLMGLFAFGCAAGNCIGGNIKVKQKQKVIK